MESIKGLALQFFTSRERQHPREQARPELAPKSQLGLARANSYSRSLRSKSDCGSFVSPFHHHASDSPKGEQRVQFCHFNTWLRALREHHRRADPITIPDGSGPAPSTEEKTGEREEEGPVQRPTATWWQLLEPCAPPESHQDRCPPWETTAADLCYLTSWTLSSSSNGLRPRGELGEVRNTHVPRTSTALPALRGARRSPGRCQRASCPGRGSPARPRTCWLPAVGLRQLCQQRVLLRFLTRR